MRKITKLLTLALAALMIMGAMPVSAAFTDVSVENEALYEAVELLSTLGVAKGTTDTTFGPEELVTRQQMAAFVYRLMKAGRSSEGGVNTTPFTDLKDSTFFNMISWAANAGIIKGTSATTFNPTGNITLQDAYVMVVRALGYENEGPLVYPHGYVDQAEAIGLDEDIPSTVDYTDNLNRGQVAIILANAFYADMNEKTVEYKWVYNTTDGKEPASDGSNIPSGMQPGSITAQYVAKETVETIAHKIFDVVEETLFVTGTTHYTFGATNAAEYNEKNDVEFVYGTRFDEDGAVVSGSAYEYKMEDLGLEGESDDYFLDELTIFVKKDADGDVTKDVVLAAKSNLVKKTVKAADVVIERSAKTDELYYVDADKKNGDKVMTGYVEFGGLKAYLDINAAPYSYRTLDNATELGFIELKSVAYNEVAPEHTIYTYGVKSASNYDADDTDATTGAYDVLTKAFEADFGRVYNEGLYEADVYDCNGDGYADLLFVKDYDFVQIRDKKNVKYAGIKQDGNINYITVKDAIIEGEYANEDYVLAYIAPNGEEYVKVAEVIKPITEKVTTTASNSKSVTATFANGTKLEFVDANKKFAGATTTNPFTAGKTYKVYVKDDVLLLNTTKTSTEFDTTAEYAIVLPKDEDAASIIITTQSIEGGEYTEKYFVKAVINGAVKTIQLADYANLFYNYNGTEWVANDNNDVESQKITDKALAEYAVTNYLAGKFSTYTNTTSGAYVFTAVDFANASDVNVADKFADTENENAIYFDVTGDVTIKHFQGNIYETSSITGIKRFKVNDYSKLIIKTFDDEADEDVYTVYNASNLSKFDDTVFEDVKAVFINNTESTQVEDLGILFATLPGNEFASNETKEHRIVINKATISNDDNKAVEVYTLLNIKTGEKTENVKAATEGDTFNTKDYVVLDENGSIKNKVTASGTFAKNTLYGPKDFASFDKENNLLSVAGDTNTYILDEDVTVLVFIDEDEYYVRDEDALDNKNNPYEELEDVNDDGDADTTEKTLVLTMIGTDDEDSNKTDIKHVNTIVVTIK